MNYLQRGEVIKLIKKHFPEVGENTIRVYIERGIIKHSKMGVHNKLFSEDYINEILKCGKKMIDWEKVKNIPIDKD